MVFLSQFLIWRKKPQCIFRFISKCWYTNRISWWTGGQILPIRCYPFLAEILPHFISKGFDFREGILKNYKQSCFFIFFSFLLFRATPVAYGSSRARGQIRTVAAGLHHRYSTAGSEPSLWPTPRQRQIPNMVTVMTGDDTHINFIFSFLFLALFPTCLPLSEVRNQTRILMDTSWICFHWATMRTPNHAFLSDSM